MDPQTEFQIACDSCPRMATVVLGTYGISGAAPAAGSRAWSGTDWYMPTTKRKSPWGLVLTILIGVAAGAAVAAGRLVALP